MDNTGLSGENKTSLFRVAVAALFSVLVLALGLLLRGIGADNFFQGVLVCAWLDIATAILKRGENGESQPE